MGANLQIIGFKDSIKTLEQARKDFNKRAEQDRHENGHSYSGSFGMLNRLQYVSTVFNTVEDFEKYLENKGKNDGYIAQVKVIRETNPLKKARLEAHQASQALCEVNQGYRYEGWQRVEFKVTPAMKRRAQAKFEKTEAKYKKILEAQIAKSTKTRWIAGGWVEE